MELTWPEPKPSPIPPPGAPPTSTQKDADIRSVLLQAYSDRGEWARHYSAVRMTLGTFFITAAAGVLTLRWDMPQWAIAAAAGGVFLVGVILFMVFSHFTFDEMNGQLDIVDSYHKALGAPPIDPSKRSGLWKWCGTGLPIAILFIVAFLAFGGWWLRFSKPESRTTVPMKVQVGQQHEITIDVPVIVTVP